MGESSEFLLFGGLLLAGLFALLLAIWLLMLAFAGAIVMLSLAAAQGFVGLVAFVAAWVFLFPIMLVIAIVLGFVASLGERSEKKEERRKSDVAVWRHKHLGEPLPNKNATRDK